jgi:thiol-disulfide isomerase/thioredoxin
MRRMNRRSSLFAAATWLSLALLAASAWPERANAQSSSGVVGTRAELSGPTLSGAALSLQNLRGKVVLVWFWSTGCAVCRDVLPELRSNYAGWYGKPFEIVTVATDNLADDAVRYERITQSIVPLTQAMPAMWRRDPKHRDNFPVGLSLPAAFLIDASGHIVEQYSGRIPAQAWDRIAELLP